MQRGLVADYMQHLRRRGLSERTREEYGILLRAYAAEIDVLVVSTAQIEQWLDARHIEARARVTYTGCLAGFHNWLVDEEWRKDDPTRKVVRPKLPKRLPRPAATDELRGAMLAARSQPRMLLWLCLAAYEGMRVHEIAALRWQNLELETGVLRLTVTKGDKERLVPLADSTREAFNLYGFKRSGWVFPAMLGGKKPTGYHIEAQTVTTAISRFLRANGVNATAHQLRHWFGTEVYRRTRDIMLVGDLLGHADLRTTTGYVKLVPSQEAVEAVRKLDVDREGGVASVVTAVLLVVVLAMTGVATLRPPVGKGRGHETVVVGCAGGIARSRARAGVRSRGPVQPRLAVARGPADRWVLKPLAAHAAAGW